MKEETLYKIIEIKRFIFRLPLWPVFFCLWVRNELMWQRSERGRMKKVRISGWDQVNFEDIYYSRESSDSTGGFWKILVTVESDEISPDKQALLKRQKEWGEFNGFSIDDDVFGGITNQHWVPKDEADERGWKYDIAHSMEWTECVEDENGDIQEVELEKPKMRQDGLVLANLGKEKLRVDLCEISREWEEHAIKCRLDRDLNHGEPDHMNISNAGWHKLSIVATIKPKPGSAPVCTV